MADQSRPDLCVVGAGALGIALALHAKRLGAKVVLVDRGVPEPGDGPQQALQLAALQASAARAHQMRHAAALGLTNAEPKVGMKAVQERALDIARVQAPASDHDRLTALGIEVVRGSAAFADPHSLMAGDLQIRPKAIVLATGGKRLPPDIPGLDQIDYFTPDSILDNKRKLTHLLVIGGDPAGFSLAQAFARLGAEVTLVPQGRALPGHDGETVAILIAALAEEGVRIVDGATVRQILPRAQGTGALIDLASGEEEALDVSHILVASEMEADLTDLAPERARLRPARGASAALVSGRLGETGNRRIRVTGPAAGIGQWQHALVHGRAVVEALVLGAPLKPLAHSPRLVMTEPALAEIGTLATRKAGAGQSLIRVSLVENAQARALGSAAGLVKVLTDSRGRISGASLVGPGAGEMAAMLALAMEQDIALAELSRLSLPHPSLMSSLAALAEMAAAARPVPAWARRWLAFRRLLPF